MTRIGTKFIPLFGKFKRETRENLVWIHDLSDAFDVDEYIYIDGCHVNGRGNQIIAKRISERLNPLEL
jgi:lysophospholipase L1-like esterase